jgi:hypothetical protein
MSNEVNPRQSWIRCAKTGKSYLLADALGEYSGRGESIFGELGMIGLLRRQDVEGYKIRMPAKLFTNRKFGRVLWLSCKDDFSADGPNLREGRPAFCFTAEGAKEIMRLHSLRYGSVQGKEDKAEV